MPDQYADPNAYRVAKARRIAYLLASFKRENITPEEQDELDEWVGASDKNMQLFAGLTNEENIRNGLAWINENIPVTLNKSRKGFEFRKRWKIKMTHVYFVASLLVALFIFLATLKAQTGSR
jgi:hypothetical protein